MSSLTPKDRSDEASWVATNEGSINGLLTLVPTCGGLYVAMQNAAFVKRTNWQSRTAMVIMPALFMFTWTAEQKLSRKMKEMSEESRHATETVGWAERELTRTKQVRRADSKIKKGMDNWTTEGHLTNLYRQSVEESGVRIVDGTLGWHHRAANFVAENPFKTLATFAVPSVAAIFWGQSGQEHLQMSMKLLHTRVFGQFATISLLLGVMGFKELMDQKGKFITQAEAEARVEEMHNVRAALLQRRMTWHKRQNKNSNKLMKKI
jgi:hypothetical protein